MKDRRLLLFERWVLQWFMKWIPLPYYLTIGAYFLFEIGAILMIFWSEDTPFWNWERASPVFFGLAAVNSIVLFTIRLGNFLPKFFDDLTQIVETENREETVTELADRYLYSSALAPVIVLVVVLLAVALTISVIRIDFPPLIITVLSYVAFLPIAVSLGFFVALSIGIWRLLYRIGKLPIKIRLFHADNMGGLGHIGQLGLMLSYMLSFVFAIYSFGTIYAPLQPPEIKRYTYLWIVSAIIFTLISFSIVPFSLHRALRATKQKALDGLSDAYDLLFDEVLIKEAAPARKIDIPDAEKLGNVLKSLESKVDDVSVWPYTWPFVKLMAISAPQVLAFIAQKYGASFPVLIEKVKSILP